MEKGNRHHLVTRFYGGTWHPDNIVQLKENTHNAIHVVVGPATPIQTQRYFLDLSRTSLGEHVYQALSKTLSQFEGIMELEAYKPHTFDADTFKYRIGHRK